MNKYIIYGGQGKNLKGAIVESEDMDKARKKAHKEFYGAFSCICKRDLICGTVFSEGLNSEFNGVTFKKVQFNFSGNGSGVTTTYNCTIYTKPSEQQIDFIGKSKIDSVIFYNADHVTETLK